MVYGVWYKVYGVRKYTVPPPDRRHEGRRIFCFFFYRNFLYLSIKKNRMNLHLNSSVKDCVEKTKSQASESLQFIVCGFSWHIILTKGKDKSTVRSRQQTSLDFGYWRQWANGPMGPYRAHWPIGLVAHGRPFKYPMAHGLTIGLQIDPCGTFDMRLLPLRPAAPESCWIQHPKTEHKKRINKDLKGVEYPPEMDEIMDRWVRDGDWRAPWRRLARRQFSVSLHIDYLWYSG